MSPFGWLRRRRAVPVEPLVDDGSLVVVGAFDDPARADSSVVADLRAAGVDTEGGRFLVRYALRLPDAGAVGEAERLLAPDGWHVVAHDGGPEVLVRASKEMPLAGLALSRERSRMAGLAQRLGGTDAGWDVLSRPTAI